MNGLHAGVRTQESGPAVYQTGNNQHQPVRLGTARGPKQMEAQVTINAERVWCRHVLVVFFILMRWHRQSGHDAHGVEVQR